MHGIKKYKPFNVQKELLHQLQLAKIGHVQETNIDSRSSCWLKSRRETSKGVSIYHEKEWMLTREFEVI